MVSSLSMVETLLNEFYQPDATNVRKHEIETELIAFKSQADAWQLCLRVATTQETIHKNEFLWLFATSTIEHAITKRWSFLSNIDRGILRETLWQTYVNLTITSDYSIRRQRDTIAQLIALMGKREFPDEHPTYMAHCMELIKTNFSLGINLLRITSEEVVSNREDLSTERKNYFQSCICMCISDVMDLLTKFLIIVVCHVNGKDIYTMPSNLLDYRLLTALPNDNQFSSVSLDLLKCIQHMVSWIRTDLITENFLLSILDLSQWKSLQSPISLASLYIVNELLYLQKPLPYAMIVMTGVNSLLEHHNQTVEQQNEMYIDKFRELLRLYTVKYYPRLIHHPDMLETFLKGLYRCTIYKNGALDFTEKLEIWSPILRAFKTNPSNMQRFSDIIPELTNEILKRIQFEYNKPDLELLDNEIIEDNSQTEFQQYLSQCIDCITLMAEASPSIVFTEVFKHWSTCHAQFQALGNDIDCGKTYEITRKIKSRNFPENLRDFSSVCQTIVGIIPILDLQHNSINMDINRRLELLIENLLGTLKFLTKNQLYTIGGDKICSTYQTDLNQLYAQILLAIRSILGLSLIDYSKSQDVLTILCDALGSILSPQTTIITTTDSANIRVPISSIVCLAASELLLCIASVIRSKCLLEIPSILSLMQQGPRLSHLPTKAYANIYISIISYLVLPWKNQQQQDFPKRCMVLREYIECLAQNFLELDLAIDDVRDTEAIPITRDVLSTFSVIVDFFKDSNNTTKDMLATSMKSVITRALEIYNIFGMTSNSIALSVASFSLSILRSLQSQLGSPFIKEMINLFINVCSREQITASRFAVLEKILLMFQLIVEQPGSLSMVPAILDLSIKQILPLLATTSSSVEVMNNNNSDVPNALYSLFDSILMNKWQYFYKPHIQVNGSLQQISSDNLHPEHFMSILNSYGQVLVSGTDPNIRRNVLQSLQSVNERWRLYHRPLFNDNLLLLFQRALINVLLSGEGALHFELLSIALFTMGQVDTLKLRESFLTAGFPVNIKIIDDICLSTDIPTFSLKLTQLIQDAHCVNLTQQATAITSS